MSESRAEMVGRWRREGREKEAATFRERVREDCRAKGVNRKEANDHAWNEAAKAFPPLPAKEPVTGPDPGPGPANTETFAESTPERPAPRGRIAGLDMVPESWPDLPSSSSLQTELAWVQANRLAVVHETASGGFVVDLSKAVEPAPSRSALSWLESSIRFPSKFVDMLSRKLVDDDAEDVLAKREQKSIAEIDQILEQCNLEFAEKMAANASETVRERVRSVMPDWMRWYDIDESHRATLEAHVCGLVQECVDAAAKEP